MESGDRELTWASYLGRNTVAAMVDLIRHLSSDLNDQQPTSADQVERIRFADPVSDVERSSDAAEHHAASTDVLWMCGCLYATMTRTDSLNHHVVAAPVFAGEGRPVYRSVIVARYRGPTGLEEALSGLLAVNEPQSWSGHHGLRRFVTNTVSAERWFAAVTVTGSHQQSVLAVATGQADCAAIDQTVWRYISQREPELAATLRVIGTTDDWPAPPLVVSNRLPPTVVERLTSSIRAAPGGPEVTAFVKVDPSIYRDMARA